MKRELQRLQSLNRQGRRYGVNRSDPGDRPGGACRGTELHVGKGCTGMGMGVWVRGVRAGEMHG